MLLVGISCPVLSRGDDVVTYLGGKGGKQTIRRTGQIEEYDGQGLVLVTPQGRKETIPLEKLVDFQTTSSPEELSGDQLRSAGQLVEAVETYKKARRAEPRKWVGRRIATRLIDCYDGLGQIDQAGEEFLAIVAVDAETPHFGSIPLAWRTPSLSGSGLAGPTTTRATKWLAATDQPTAALLGASWLLGGAERAKAIKVLKSLSSDLDPRIAHLATAQLWRTTLVTSTAADAEKWQQQINRMPAELRAGPLLVHGDLLARIDRAEDALLAYLQVPLVYHDRQTLSGEGLLSAASVLEKLKRNDDAQRLYRELLAKYPAFAKQHEVAARLREPGNQGQADGNK